MLKGISTYILVVLVMWQNLAFAAMPCHMQPHKMTHTMPSFQITEMNHSMEDHALMDMDVVSTMSDEDCCDTKCYCPTNACGALHFVNMSSGYNPLHVPNERVESALIHFESSFPRSLYKPPIFA
ncbi:hypothetical protein NI389_18705 (plasmid) [Pseudoalteromonas xiamenensis]|uniref:hypothetical protein n=1 Tax=Pseudoalteromonas xiamenensis TaxID=882626 RepID=UPI0027E3DFEE|nr:hypothetical protein [Pseudoalteromonas xiamenensis]WMN61838.1 hypothetical protein NI389_18705 [Pseudoalteromonas xiamenensis]